LGTVNVTVFQGGATSNSVPFTYAAPVLTSISPATGPASGGTLATINGSGIAPSATVRFGNLAAPVSTVTGSTQLTVTVPAGTGTVNVTVTQGGATSNSVPFTYAGPAVSSISPATGPTTGGTLVTITGSGFTQPATAYFGAAAVQAQVVSSSVMTAVAPAGTGTVDITVSDSAGTSATTPSDLFTYQSPKSQIITFGPIAAQTSGISISLVATTTSGLAVTFTSITPSVCTATGAVANLLANGTCTIQASQAGNASYLAATPVLQSFGVSAPAPAVSLTVSSQQVTYPSWTNVVIAPGQIGNHVPTGTVTLFDGSTSVATLTLGGDGKAYYSMTPLHVGTHALTATYAGDAYNHSASSPVVIFIVLPAAVTINASCWGTGPYGTNATCQANLSSAAGSPSGTLSYTVDGGSAVQLTLANGGAQFTLTAPAAGNHVVSIAFGQQGDFATARPFTQSFTIAQAPVSLSLTPSSWYTSASNGVSFTAVVSSWSAGPPSGIGSMQFFDGNNLLATVPVDASGQASYSSSTLKPGSHTVTATYTGSTNYSGGSVSVIITLTP
jgi:hypothetical protein